MPRVFSLWEKNTGLLGLLPDGAERPKSVSVIRRGEQIRGPSIIQVCSDNRGARMHENVSVRRST
jgi:hypothetical protein